MFAIYQTDDGRIAPLEQKAAAAITPALGLALAPNADGNLALATGTTAPEYLCAAEMETVTAGDWIPVVKINHDTIYKTTLSAAGTSLKVGSKVTLHTDGAQVTATTTGGVAEIVAMDGTAAGDTVYVRF